MENYLHKISATLWLKILNRFTLKLKIMNFKTPYNSKNFPLGEFEKVSPSPSMTVPDQTMTVKEIMDRFARGLPVGGHKVPIYEGEENDMPDVSHMDLADRQALYESVQDELDEIKAKLNKKQRERIKLTLTAEEITEFRKQQKERLDAPDQGSETTNLP